MEIKDPSILASIMRQGRLNQDGTVGVNSSSKSPDARSKARYDDNPGYQDKVKASAARFKEHMQKHWAEGKKSDPDNHTK